MSLRPSTLLASALLSACPALAQGNVLMILADDVGVDKIGAYAEGQQIPPTPNIDALAAGGVLFRNAWSNATSSTTRATIMTGRYSFRTGIGYLVLPTGPALAQSETILPEVLDLGAPGVWSHANIGKWHLGNSTVGGLLAPNLAGFSHSAGILTNMEVGETYFNWPKVVDGVQTQSTNYITTDQIDEALLWITTAPEPWYCQVWLWAAHAPYIDPPLALHTYTLPPLIPHGDAKPFYDATVQSMDTEVGRLLGSIAPEVLANTTIIFSADNATVPEATIAPFLVSHAKVSVYEGGINVPLIVKGPQVVNPGREEAFLIHTVDIFDTVAEIAGIDPAAVVPPGTTLDSVSFLPYLTSTSAAPQRSLVFSELFYPVLFPNMYAVRNARYKLIRMGSPPAEQFYDLLVDPFEQVNKLVSGPMTTLELRNYRMLKAHLQQVLSS